MQTYIVSFNVQFKTVRRIIATLYRPSRARKRKSFTTVLYSRRCFFLSFFLITDEICRNVGKTLPNDMPYGFRRGARRSISDAISSRGYDIRADCARRRSGRLNYRLYRTRYNVIIMIIIIIYLTSHSVNHPKRHLVCTAFLLCARGKFIVL